MSATILFWAATIAQIALAIAMVLASVRMIRGPRAQDRVLGLMHSIATRCCCCSFLAYVLEIHYILKFH